MNKSKYSIRRSGWCSCHAGPWVKRPGCALTMPGLRKGEKPAATFWSPPRLWEGAPGLSLLCPTQRFRCPNHATCPNTVCLFRSDFLSVRCPCLRGTPCPSPGQRRWLNLRYPAQTGYLLAAILAPEGSHPQPHPQQNPLLVPLCFHRTSDICLGALTLPGSTVIICGRSVSPPTRKPLGPLCLAW